MIEIIDNGILIHTMSCGEKSITMLENIIITDMVMLSLAMNTEIKLLKITSKIIMRVNTYMAPFKQHQLKMEFINGLSLEMQPWVCQMKTSMMGNLVSMTMIAKKNVYKILPAKVTLSMLFLLIPVTTTVPQKCRKLSVPIAVL